MYNYRNSKSNIINILKSKTPVEKRSSIPTDDKEFTFSNGFLCLTSALFVDEIGIMIISFIVILGRVIFTKKRSNDYL